MGWWKAFADGRGVYGGEEVEDYGGGVEGGARGALAGIMERVAGWRAGGRAGFDVCLGGLGAVDLHYTKPQYKIHLSQMPLCLAACIHEHQ